MNPDRHCLVLVTVPDRKVADALANSAVAEGLAACCSIIPGVTSVYRWEEAIHEDAELQLLFKTRSDLFERLETLIKRLHPYKVPEIIMTSITGGSAAYLAWISASTQAAGQPDAESHG